MQRPSRVVSETTCFLEAETPETTTLELLSDLRRRGFSLTPQSGQIIVRPASQLTPNLRELIATNKAALLAALHADHPAKPSGPGRVPVQATPDQVLRLLSRAGAVAFDLETTGLDPRRDKVRLLSVCDGRTTLTLDCFAHDVRPLLPAFRGKILIAHHAAFDLGFLWHLGLTDLPETVCTYLLAQLVTAGQGGGAHGFPPLGLDDCCERWLGRTLDKTLQASDWSGPLSAEQLAYAGRDAEVLIPLFRKMKEELEAADLLTVSDIELRALPAFIWMAQTGVPFDQDAWEALAAKAGAAKRDLERQLDTAAPYRERGLFGEADPWNWSSPKQMAELFNLLAAETGFKVSGTNDATLALLNHPLAELLRKHRHQAQLVKMYGANWLDGATIAGGRVYASWLQIGAASGRTSCARPNMQQVPRDEDPATKQAAYRACVKAPPGKVLVKADYSTLQMRIAAKWAKDQALTKIFRENGDTHTATAQALLGKQKVSKEERQIAKSANFALLFGAGSEGLRIYAKTTFGVDMSEAEAARHREKFFRTYHGLARWHAQTKKAHAKETRSASGRRRELPPNAPDTWRLNSPVQADEADGLKLALALLWERRAECPTAAPVLAVHDEIVVECPEGGAEEASAWLKRAMVEGMQPWLDPLPVEVEVSVHRTWGG